MAVAEKLILLCSCYGAAGIVVAAVFLTLGIDRIDDGARGAYAFRPLLIPGIVLLWPLVLVRWYALEARAGTASREDRQG